MTGFPASKDDTLWCPDPIRHGSFQPPVSWSRLVVADSPRPEDRRLEHRCGLCGMLISSADADLMRGVLWCKEHGSKRAMAHALGISEGTLQSWKKKLGL